VATVTPAHVRADIGCLVHRGLGVTELSRGAARVLRRAVPFDGVCLVTIDPATVLPTGEVIDQGLPAAATERLTEIEVGEDDYIKFSALGRAGSRGSGPGRPGSGGPGSGGPGSGGPGAGGPAASLGEATGGDLHLSRRHRELKHPHGFGDELRVALVDDSGTWGGLTLLREAGRRPFAAADTRLVASVARQLAEGIQRALSASALAAGDPADGGGDEPGAGLLLLADDNSIDVADPAAERWLDELRADRPEAHLPPVVTAVAARARTAATGHGDHGTPDLARARIRTPSGRWLVARGSLLGDGATARTAVILEPARPPELAPLIAAAYQLTDRERVVTELVARGHPTEAIAERLHLSPYTVQDHLKAIFDKVGAGSRGELVARLFFDHYAPRLTDGTPPGPTGWFTR
jgi:DNA-binding CsgD family transcriptional regulator